MRTVAFALDRFFSRKALLAPQSIKDFKVPNMLARELRLAENRVLLMTDEGLHQFRTMVSVVDDADVFDGLADYSDVAGACRDVLAELLSIGQRPDNAEELVELIRTRLVSKIQTRIFAVPILGLELVELEALELGSMRVVAAHVSHLDAANVRHDHTDLAKTIETTNAKLWLIGSACGTERVAEVKFRTQAELAVGMLAISAGSMYEDGATAFRIGVVMSPEQAYGKAAWFSWTEQKRDLTTHLNFVRSQNFKIDADLAQQFNDAGVFVKAFALLQKEVRSPLEEAVAKAVYWYSDAHREAVPVMKLVKYWSCVETFFSADNKDVAQAVSVGLTTVLVFGGFGFVPLANYAETKRRIAKLYNLRSRALHGAAHRHVSLKDASDLSQWVAWMLINMVVFTGNGYTKLEQVKRNCERLDAQATRHKEP